MVKLDCEGNTRAMVHYHPYLKVTNLHLFLISYTNRCPNAFDEFVYGSQNYNIFVKFATLVCKLASWLKPR